MLADLTDELLWPRLFRAPALALRMNRLIVAFVALLLVGLVAQIPSPFGDHRTLSKLWGDVYSDAVRSIRDRRLDTAADPTWLRTEGSAPTSEFSEKGAVGFWLPLMEPVVKPVRRAKDLVWLHPAEAALFGLPCLLLMAVAGAAVSRGAAVEFSQGVVLSWTQSLGFAASRWMAVVVAIVLPLTVAIVTVGGLALAGWVLLRWPVVSFVGAALYPVALVLGFVVVLVLAGLVLGGVMLVPAIAAEGGGYGGDGLDALQRVYAYVPAKPVRLALYVTLLAVQLLAMLWVLTWLADQTVSVSWWASWRLLPTEVAAGLGGRGGAGADWKTSGPAWLLALWNAVPGMLVSAFGVSYVFCGGTVLYALARKLIDGQDVDEVWQPTLVPGTQSPTKAAAGQ